ncbi:Mov34/MPN/PAD-1 family protein [Parahaliea aestuarii]|uniref:JAB domain-containing protein n=1 Tax=Parahaliea aestuarii TaxID=1852021 RepID=A0A5C8ZQ69_9GAMM|nr:hypothetical protein FVW59_14990 [Parahaliea aestuarii]
MLQDRVILNPIGGYILIRSRVFETLKSYTQTGNRPEAGGILLGSYRGVHLEITDATTPFPTDKSSRNHFNRLSKGHQEYAEQIWSTSSRLVTYIGEWHTHPIPSPNPSHQDVISWTRDLPSRNMLLLIQGLSDVYIGIHSPTTGLISVPE